MPDITMCLNKDCPMNYKCWRFTSTPNEFLQSAQEFQYEIIDDEEFSCDYFIKTR